MEKERKERNRLVGGRKQLDFPRIVQKRDPRGKNREVQNVRFTVSAVAVSISI